MPAWQDAAPRHVEKGDDGCLSFSLPPCVPLGGSLEESGFQSTAYMYFVV